MALSLLLMILLGLLIAIALLYEVKKDNQQPKIQVYAIYPQGAIKEPIVGQELPKRAEVKGFVQKE